ncbi:MAG TPA: ferric reductase-like transmembrane domain-containing protein [Solirubrobacteraceae bacterium]|jgi:sulfoxide reductase heme-binding subunit YedZ
MTALAALAPVWVTARAAGVAALLCASLAISAGLLMAMKPPALRRRRLELRTAHEALALATFAFIAVHALALLLDPVLAPGLAGILVPFGAAYERLGTALGQLAAAGMLVLGLTFYVRRRVGGERWRRAHRAVPAFWLLAVGHAILTGTDARAWWLLVSLAAPVLSAVALLVVRYDSDSAYARASP